MSAPPLAAPAATPTTATDQPRAGPQAPHTLMEPIMSTIPPETALHVLAAFGRGGILPGRFGQQLISLISGADEQNLARLADVFPAEVEAVRLAQYDKNGIAKLQAIASGQAAA